MKKILTLIAAIAVASGSAVAQGTFTFANFVGAVDIQATLNSSPAGLIGPQYKVDVIYNGSAIATQDFFASEAGAGYFVGPVVTVDGAFGGDVISVHLYGYDSTNPALTFGETSPFNVALGGLTSGGSTLPPGDLRNMTPLDIVTVPEPSTIAMIALGLGAVVFRFRRK